MSLDQYLLNKKSNAKNYIFISYNVNVIVLTFNELRLIIIRKLVGVAM
jgi:hypothetical protein